MAFAFHQHVKPGMVIWRPVHLGCTYGPLGHFPEVSIRNGGTCGRACMFTMPFIRENQFFEPSINWWNGEGKARGIVTFIESPKGEPCTIPVNWFGHIIKWCHPSHMIVTPLLGDLERYVEWRKDLITKGFTENPWHDDAPRFMALPRIYINNHVSDDKSLEWTIKPFK